MFMLNEVFKSLLLSWMGSLSLSAATSPLMNIALQTAAHGDHVPEVERHIRTLKERARAIYNTLPFERLPARIIIEMVYYCNFWLNAFPHQDGVSATLSPRNIVLGHGIDFSKHCRIEFGAYAQVHEEHDNSLAPRTVGAIALRPTGNNYGSYYFFNLNTGRLLNRSRWTELPMPSDVITRVHKMSRRGRQGLEFLNRNGQPFVYPATNNTADCNLDDSDDDDNHSFNPDDDDNHSFNPDHDGDLPPDDDDGADVPDIAGVYDHAGYDFVADDNDPPFDDYNDSDEYANAADTDEYANAAAANVMNDNNAGNMDVEPAAMPMNENEAEQMAGVPDHAPHEPAGVMMQGDNDNNGDPVTDTAAEMEERYGPRTTTYNIRPATTESSGLRPPTHRP